MKRTLFVIFIFVAGSALFAQQNTSAPQKHALVIGNNNYANIKKLENPVNDASDIAEKLKKLDYNVELQINMSNVAMARSITNFVQKLSMNRDSEGFFWFAGHAVQINGENYLLPVDVNNSNEVETVHSSYSVRRLVDSLDKVARNKVNVIVLDACRDNPFVNMPGSFRNVARGLSMIENLPSDLLVIYSTAAGAVAQDGTGQRNSPFTQAFLQNMESNDDIQIVFRTIARETMRLTNNNQRPFHDGSFLNLDFYSLNPSKNRITPEVQPVVRPESGSQPAPQYRLVPQGFEFVEGGTFQMGNASGGDDDERPVRNVTVKSFYMSKYEVTQKEWFDVMGTTIKQQRDLADKTWPLAGEDNNYPMYYVNWHEAIEYCNKRSLKEGLTPAYRGSGNNITCDWDASGYRLPTEAEWEYAAKGGKLGFLVTEYSGSNNADAVAWYYGNSGDKTQPVGKKTPNELGLYDMSGNVWEWCWDWYGTYPNTAQTDPRGASSGSGRVVRGGSWRNAAADVRSACRGNVTPTYRYNDLGFRLVRP
ncbi:MAG: SUMF1/EgtB/PvdO family nonheme iron enzyme [Treponema sp.]|nr:SUMF1/EgtB/PvdO family nonheme iron enzyme [Treponema sp.]MCL2272981.1 SUMF1/EgtB/PvdO family nonheme iron enzyme [Treponema sp.]